jgi:hypothetical protein
LQLRGVADYKSSAQRVGALCIAGLALRMASHVLPCSRELMRSATDLPEDSKGTRTFLWPWVQHLGIAGGFWPFLTAKRAIPVRGYRAESCGIYSATVTQHHLKSPAGDGVAYGTPPPRRSSRHLPFLGRLLRSKAAIENLSGTSCHLPLPGEAPAATPRCVF